jgi:hypothetical protein
MGEFNALVPLFDKSDIDIFPLLQSKLFTLLLTHMVTKNMDTLIKDSYPALLANLLTYLIT